MRVFQNIIFPFDRKASASQIRDSLKKFGRKTGDGNNWVKVGALKVVIDGGILTGTAYISQGWGKNARDIYGINDPEYRGELFYSKDELVTLIAVAEEGGWKFTAHVTGGGAVDTLLAAYETVNLSKPLTKKRFSIIHGNFYSPESIRKMAAMGIYADMQPAWYYKDADLINKVLGKDIMRHSSLALNDRSRHYDQWRLDHMVKLDPDASINPYNPFLAMWSVITRKTERGTVFNREQAISRKEALKMYTINNAYASFEEHLKGSIEPGKLADLVILSDDILTCSFEKIREIKPLLTMVNGRVVFDKGFFNSLQ